MKKIAIVVVVLIVGLVLAKNMIVQAVMVSGIKDITGLGLKMRSANVGLLSTFISLNDVKILNPGNFSDRLMADLPQLYVDYNLGDFFKGKVHLEDLRINIKELVVIKNEANQVNINSLKALLPKGGGKPPQIQIDFLNLKIGKVIYKDYLLGKTAGREYNLNLDENFKNINDPNALVSLILVRALSKTNIASLTGIDLGQLKEDVSKALIEKADSTVLEIKEKAEGSLRQIFNQSR